jgi:hypothetical protein
MDVLKPEIWSIKEDLNHIGETGESQVVYLNDTKLKQDMSTVEFRNELEQIHHLMLLSNTANTLYHRFYAHRSLVFAFDRLPSQEVMERELDIKVRNIQLKLLAADIVKFNELMIFFLQLCNDIAVIIQRLASLDPSKEIFSDVLLYELVRCMDKVLFF